MSDLTYPEVGATAGELPAGYRHLRKVRDLGAGRPVFEAASRALLTWQMHERAGVRLVSGPARAVEGADVSFRWWGIPIECRVVDVVDEPDRQGFAYGTLARHPERGEERFVVSIDPETGSVLATITAFSRPSGPLARLAGPAGRFAQDRMTQRYLDSLS